MFADQVVCVLKQQLNVAEVPYNHQQRSLKALSAQFMFKSGLVAEQIKFFSPVFSLRRR